jgi:hypothetical protein
VATAELQDPRLAKLVGLAWRTVPAIEANTAIERARRATASVERSLVLGDGDAGPAGEPAEPEDLEEADDAAPPARSYELLLAPDATFEEFAARHLPRLVYHLESIGAHLPRAAGVVVCLFVGESLHFLQAGELISGVCAELGISAQELSRRHGTGELRTAVREATERLALPPGEPD